MADTRPPSSIEAGPHRQATKQKLRDLAIIRVPPSDFPVEEIDPITPEDLEFLVPTKLDSKFIVRQYKVK
jgi:hypothetical protein